MSYSNKYRDPDTYCEVCGITLELEDGCRICNHCNPFLLTGNLRNAQHQRDPHASTDASDCADVPKLQGTQRQGLAEGRRASTDNSQPPDGETGVAPVSGLLKAEVNSPSDTLNNYHPMEACRNPLIENKELLRDNKQLRKQLAAERDAVREFERRLLEQAEEFERQLATERKKWEQENSLHIQAVNAYGQLEKATIKLRKQLAEAPSWGW